MNIKTPAKLNSTKISPTSLILKKFSIVVAVHPYCDVRN